MQVINFNDFMQGDYVIETSLDKVIQHLQKHGSKYAVAGITVILISSIDGGVYAAGTGIDAGAKKIYKKIINVGKWVIIIKGGIDIITSITNGDFDSAKKRFVGYLLAYGTLFALPWGMDQVEELFNDEETFKEE